MTETAGHQTLSVETPESVTFAFELAGIASRGAALIIDTALLTLVILAEVLLATAVTAGLGAALGDAAVEGVVAWVIGASIVAAFATYWGYYIFSEVARNGRTPGKQLLGIRVVRDDGGRVGVIESVIRNVIRLVDMLPGYYAVGLVAALLSSSGKRLGDMAAGTVVVRDSGEVSLSLEGAGRSPRVALVHDFLGRRGELTPEARYQVAVAILAAWGEEPGEWDEPTIAGRLADLAGARPVDATRASI